MRPNHSEKTAIDQSTSDSADMAAPAQRCGREGCTRRKKTDGYCSRLCTEIDLRLTKTRALIAERGISSTAAALWAAAVSLSDQLSEVHRLENLVTSTKVTR